MKRIIIAAALALPFAAQATPVASFNDHPEQYITWTEIQGSSGGKAARVLPSFNDNPEILADEAPVVNTTVLAGVNFGYPAY